MKKALNTARIFVGVLFIFSGLVKANDPLGLSYKMQEFFEVWGWGFLDSFALSFSILMIAFEIIAGVAVLLGWRMKLFSWLLLLLIIFFTFLTGYAVLSGKIRTCGCFGDCIPLKADQSFTKDIILLVLILFIFRYRNLIGPLFSPVVCGRILILTTLFSLAIQGYVFKHLPVVDCLPYKIGKNILQQMKVPPGALPDSTEISFVYTKNGKELEFGSSNFPADFDDSLYHFVKRYDKIIRKGNAEPAIKDFSLNSAAGADSTNTILSQPGYVVLFFVKDNMNTDYNRSQNIHLRNLLADAASKRIPSYTITNSKEVLAQLQLATKDSLFTGPHAFMCDAVAIKTAARANPTLYLLKEGTIVQKWAYADFAKAAETVKQLK